MHVDLGGKGSARTGAVVEPTTIGAYEVNRITLSNEHATVVLTDLGARLLEVRFPDRHGEFADVVLGRPDLDSAADDPNYMGATAGRYANRIRRGRFRLDGCDHQVSINENDNHLHGGARGFDRHVWATELDVDGLGVTFSRISASGEEGFPGELVVRTHYILTGASLSITMTARSSEPTLVNLVNHAYWNLGGHPSGTVLDHEVAIDADYYTPVDDEMLPTGEILRVSGSPFDFRRGKPVRQGQSQVHASGAGRVVGDLGGYDHNWVLNGTGLRDVASVTDHHSGRRLTLATNQPGLHLYTGGYLGGTTAKAPATTYPAYAGLTLETQTFPDAANHPHFPSPVLRPEAEYVNDVILTFDNVS